MIAAIDLGSQLESFLNAAERLFDRLAGIGWGYMVAGLALSLGLQLCRAHAWGNALRAAYPDKQVSERGIAASFLVGVGMNGILPARAGDAAKVVLAKRTVQGSSYPAVISSFVVLSPFDTAMGILVLLYALTQGLIPAGPALPDLPAFEISFWAAHPYALVLTIVGLATLGATLFLFLARPVEQLWRRLKQGVAIFGQPWRYLREVAAWQMVAWLLRFASFWFFLEAFHIGGSVANVLLVMGVQSVSSALPFTPGGAGAQQALLVATLPGPSHAAVLAYSVGQQLAVMAWSVTVGFLALLLYFRTPNWRLLIREGREARSAALKHSAASSASRPGGGGPG